MRRASHQSVRDRAAIVGYYCYGRWEEWGVPPINTASRPVATLEEAKEQQRRRAEDYIEKRLQEKQNDGP